MTQVALRAESEFAAGVGCHACRQNGHFCQAHDYGENDKPACKTCLTGDLCGPMKARERKVELDGPELPPAQPPEQFNGHSTLCVYGCGKRRHRGVCAARRAATGRPQPDGGTGTEPRLPAHEVERIQHTAVLDEVKRRIAEREDVPVTKSQPVPEEHRAAIRTLDEPRDSVAISGVKHVIESPAASSTATRLASDAATAPTFEIVPRDQVPWRRWQSRDRYTELLAQLRTVPPGGSLKMRFPSEEAATRFGKHLSRALRRSKLRVLHEQHGDAIFFDVQSTNHEVLAL